jgi:Single-stranded DNA-specific exonuclease
MNYLIETTLKNRGISWDDYVKYEQYDHKPLKDSDILCAELHKIHDEGKHLVIIPDFDMDGISAGTLGFAGFSELGFHVSLYVPKPNEGYGFTRKDIDAVLDLDRDVDVIITCDVGIGCLDAIQYATDLGIEVLVTDHHIQQEVSAAKIVVDPLRLDEKYEHTGICGAYVLYQILEQYASLYDKMALRRIERLCVFAGIGTVSDSMPVLYENRKLLRDAIAVLRLCRNRELLQYMEGCAAYRSVFMGLAECLQIHFNTGKLVNDNDIDEMFFGFYLAPMFNSIKRMDGDLNRAFAVFFGDNQYADVEYLYDLNQERKAVVAKYLDATLAAQQDFAPFIYVTDAPGGICGLLAQQIMLTTGMPALVVHQNDDLSYSGSGRSPAWYPFIDRMKGKIWAAGHNPAFGTAFKNDAEMVLAFALLSEDVKSVYDTLPPEIFEVKYDFVISTDKTGDIGIDVIEFMAYLEEINQFKPFGVGFEAPKILFRYDASYITEAKVMGKLKNHLKLTFFNHFDLILWNQADKEADLTSPGMHEVTGNLNKNSWNGVVSVNFIGDAD